MFRETAAVDRLATTLKKVRYLPVKAICVGRATQADKSGTEQNALPAATFAPEDNLSL